MPGLSIFNVLAIFDSVGFTTNTIPFQSGERSVDLHAGQTFAVVTHLHSLQANSFTNYFSSTAISFVSTSSPFAFFISSCIHSSVPKNGCLHVIPIYPIVAALPKDTAVILVLNIAPTFNVLPLWFAIIIPEATSLFK